MSSRNLRPRQPVAFFDRDGTIIRERRYLHNVEDLELIEGVVEGLRLVQAAGYRLVIVSNQSGVARGLFEESEVRRVNNYLVGLCADQEVVINAVYYCPHHPAGIIEQYSRDCACRKPHPGLLRRAAAELDLDLERSWLIGDKETDVLAGHAVGARTVLVMTGYGQQFAYHSSADFVVRSVFEAGRLIWGMNEGSTSSPPLLTDGIGHSKELSNDG